MPEFPTVRRPDMNELKLKYEHARDKKFYIRPGHEYKIDIILGDSTYCTTTTTTLFSYIKYTNITPPANSKANRGRWCVDGLRFFTIVQMNNKVPYL